MTVAQLHVWQERKLKFLLAMPVTDGPHETPEFLPEGIPFLSVDAIQDGELRFEACRFVSEVAHREFVRKARPRRDDILMGKAASTGKIARVKTDISFSIWSPLALLRVRSGLVEPAFCEYALKSSHVQFQIEALCNKNTQKNIGMGDIPTLVLPIPDIKTQRAVLSFLDRKTAVIDALIAKKEHLIELLEEKRQALITQAVTKGLDPNVPMKDSGMAGIGRMPAAWALKKLKFLSSQITVGIVVTPSRYYVDEGVPCPRSFNIRPGSIHSDGMAFISPESNHLHSKSIIRKGDLVAVRTGQPGTTAVVPEALDGGNCIDLIVVRRSARFDSSYLSLFMNSHAAVGQFEEGSEGALQQHFNVETAQNLLVPVPPLDEQISVRRQVDEAQQRHTAMRECVQRHIDLLREYRQALISAAVTGQLRIDAEAAA